MLAGPPNAGKSSLLNALARREAAIVSEEAGTTRDAIEVRLDLDGLPVIVTDTAGIREPQGAIEREGIRRTLAHAREADLVLWLSDASAPPVAPPPDVSARGDKFFLSLASKIDIPGASAGLECWASRPRPAPGCPSSIRRLAGMARDRIGDLSSPAITRERYRQQLKHVHERP